jgi:hypothetical protein
LGSLHLLCGDVCIGGPRFVAGLSPSLCPTTAFAAAFCSTRSTHHAGLSAQLSPRDRNYGSIQNDGGELLRRRTIQHQNPMLGDQTFFTSRIPVEASEARSRASLDIVTLSVFLCRNYEHPVQKGWCIITKRTLTTQSQSTSSPIQLTNGTGSKKKNPA